MCIHCSILTTTVDNSRVLVKVSNARTHRAAHHVPGWWIGRSLDGELSGYNMKSLVVDHSVYRVKRGPVPCTFIRRVVAVTEDLIFRPVLKLHKFSVAVKRSLTWLTHHFPLISIYSFYILLNLPSPCI